MHVSRRRLLTAGAVTAGALTSGTSVIGAGTADYDEPRNFTAELSPRNVPSTDETYVPYDGAARGVATFQLDGDVLSWTVTLSNVRCVTGGHVHDGERGESGPHLAELFNRAEPSDEIGGVYREGTFGDGDACGEDLDNCLPEGVTFDELVEKMRAGATYMQAHATDDRVIRGQIEPDSE